MKTRMLWLLIIFFVLIPPTLIWAQDHPVTVFVGGWKDRAVGEVRSAPVFMAGGMHWRSGHMSEPTIFGTMRVSPVGIGPIRPGLGIEYRRSFSEEYPLPTIAYVDITGHHDEQFGFAVADLGVGAYDHSYIRAVGRVGIIHSPQHTDIRVFGRDEIIDSFNTDKRGMRIQGVGGEFRLAPLPGLSASGSAVHYWTSSPRPENFPAAHMALTGQLMYRSPWHLGLSLDGWHTSTDRSILPDRHGLALSVGLVF
jgi:hypothetical protein